MTGNLGALLDPVVAGAPDRVALIVDGETLTFGELGHAVASVANALSGVGVGPGDRVMLVDECSPLFFGTVLGAARIGAAAAPMNHRLAPPELRALHELAGCDRAVAGAASIDLVGSALGRSPLAASVLLGWGGEPPGPANVDPADPALILFTSGTTGLPKPVPLSHGDLVPRVSLFTSTFDPSATPTVALCCVPVVHVGGLVGLLVALAAGTTSVVMRRFDAGEWLTLVERHRVERTFLVPTMLRRILDHPDFGSHDLSSLQSIAYGAAAAPADLVQRALEALPGVALSNVYGQTETLGAVTMLGPDAQSERPGSVGKVLPGIEWRIDSDTGEFQVLQHGAWHGSGDVARVDDDGYLWIEGRLADTINRGGEKLGPVEVETVLRAHPAVADVAVAGLPDEELGERVGALVVLRNPVESAELVAWCRERLAPWKVPERIAVVEEIPYTELGKVRRPEIAEIILSPGTSVSL